MLKSGFLLLVFVAMSQQVVARTCPNNDFNACAKFLGTANSASKGKSFIAAFDDVCATNSKFKCVKITVMGDLSQAQKDVKADHPKSKIYLAEQDDGKYLYIFEKKEK